MADNALTGWRRQARRPLVITVIVAVVVVGIGGATAWAASGSGTSGYRTAAVVRTSIGQSLDVIGSVEPVDDASASFQVGGQVTSVNVAVGAHVTAGETLAALDPTSLTQAVSSAELSVQSDEAKLTEDEDSQTSGDSSPSTTTTTTTPSSGTQPGGGSSSEDQIRQDQAALVADQSTESKDQQQEAADLAQAQTVCAAIPNPPTTAAEKSCAAALAKASADEQTVSNDQQAVAKAEATLASVLSSSQSSTGSTGSTGTTYAQDTVASDDSTTQTSSGTPSSSDDAQSHGGTGASADSDSAKQIADDEASIDSAQADLIEAQQALSADQLTSPIAGVVTSVGLAVGATVSADSSTDDIVIIGTHSYEVSATLTSSQVPSVKIGYRASVTVDGTLASDPGTVSQVGPVQSGTSGYTYPVVVLLPKAVTGFYSGSTAAVSIQTASATNVVAVPTSAVTTDGTRSTVTLMSNGTPVTKVVKVGLVGYIYTQIRSGVVPGDHVALADFSTPVPTSSADTGFGGFGGNGFGGSGVGNFTITRSIGGGGGAVQFGR